MLKQERYALKLAVHNYFSFVVFAHFLWQIYNKISLWKEKINTYKNVTFFHQGERCKKIYIIFF